MAEYIMKEQAFAVLTDFPEESSPENIGLAFARKAIDSLPAAEVAEVRHGRWVRDKWPSGTHKLICSECGEWSGKKSRYCPSCGARMDKEDEAQPENWPHLIHCGNIHDGEGNHA